MFNLIDPDRDAIHHARLNRFVDMDPRLLEESLDRFRAEQLPRLELVPGFRTLFFGVDRTRGRAAGITFWRSEADLRASEPAEEAARALALARAGGTMGEGLVDRYRLVFEREVAPGEPPACARLARWNGVRPSRISDALARFEDQEFGALERTPGFRGLFVGTNALLGNTLSVSLWASAADLERSLAWERGARSAMESVAGLVPRSVIADSYDVAFVPELRQTRPVLSWAEAGRRSQAGLAA